MELVMEVQVIQVMEVALVMMVTLAMEVTLVMEVTQVMEATKVMEVTQVMEETLVMGVTLVTEVTLVMEANLDTEDKTTNLKEKVMAEPLITEGMHHTVQGISSKAAIIMDITAQNQSRQRMTRYIIWDKPLHVSLS